MPILLKKVNKKKTLSVLIVSVRKHIKRLKVLKIIKLIAKLSNAIV